LLINYFDNSNRYYLIKYLNLAIFFFYIKHSKEENMTWYTPKISELAVGLEINSYACAEV